MDALGYKGIPLGAHFDRELLAAGTLDVAAGQLATPVATLRRSAVLGNARAMRDFCAEHGLHLAPHAKTTLAAGLLDVQQANGSWAMTAALPRQVALLWNHGFARVLLANEVVDPVALDWLAGQLAEDPQRQLWLYVDSTTGIERLAAAALGAGGRPFDVLVELGHTGGRTGARGIAAAVELATIVADTAGVRLAGIAGYEGTIGAVREPAVLLAVDDYLTQLRTLADELIGAGLLPQSDAVVSAGGSLFFDRVAAVLGPWARTATAAVVLRSGCYLIHDHGLYAAGTPAAAGVGGAPRFEAALSVWARIVSNPEPGLALADAGRRDLSHDAGLPVPLERVRGPERLDLSITDAHVSALSDQHTFIRFSPELDIVTGDLIRLGISHPCTTLDRHRAVFLLDDADHVTGVVATEF
jgi:D-serine deaminase-like pyridoxal phosphate-dependent protein